MRVTVLFAVVVSSKPTASGAEHDDPGTNALAAPSRLWSVSVRWENDTFGGNDRFYTDGVSLAVSHTGPSYMDPVANWLPWGRGRRTVTYDVTQAMFTPADKSLNVPDPNDRSYAGILSLGLTLHVERSNSYHGLKFMTGVVGPWSMAEETQRWIHDLGGWEQPQGWDSQLENEPIFNFAYEYRHKFRLAGERERWSVEALPVAGAWLGNVLTQGEIAGVIRFGYNMPDTFGPSLLRGMGHMPPPLWADTRTSASPWGFSIYGGAMANFVLRDITLDGNIFTDSPSVYKKYFVPATGVGISVGSRHFFASFSYVFWGEEFEGQQEYSKFGAITLSYVF